VSWQEDWINRFYRRRPGWKDGTTEFHALCEANAPPYARILEVGAGPTNPTSAFLASLGELHGVDVDAEVRGNIHLKSSALLENGRYPFPPATFDLVVSNYVVEHVEDPELHLVEIARVLKPGGAYLFRTPNLRHFLTLTSYMTSHRVHKLLANRLRALPAGTHDPWPTVYAMNTPGAVRRHARHAGLTVASLRMVEKEPSYGMAARPLFLAFMAYERLVNASERLAGFRINMFTVLRKTA
jgi:2-polyprenyl-3-methyl-5-hydroxy-6-metoxy-1,4-benzoquinol methylase